LHGIAGQFALSPEKEALLVRHLRAAELCSNSKVAVAANAKVETDASSAKVYCAQDVTYVGADAYPPHQNFVEIEVELGIGVSRAVVLGSDLTHEYVAENADYRS
jgi:N-acetylglutamate synthase/N-acetylornithine aminotransferase